MASLLQVLLIDGQLLSDLRSALLGQDVLQFDVEFFLLLNQNVLLSNFLGLGDEALVETLNLLDHLVGFRVGALELAPSVHVERLLELV